MERMTWTKHLYGGGNLPASGQAGSAAIGGGFEQTVFQDDATGYKIFWAFNLIFRQVGNLYMITAEPVDGSDAGIYGVTIQATNLQGDVLGTCTVESGIAELGAFSRYYQSAKCDIIVSESNPDNIMLEII